MDQHAIIGTCREMCPIKEREEREREGLLHRLEVREQGTYDNRRRKADPSKTIKCFSRSAAGQNTTQPCMLRPSHVLTSTVEYLVTKIVPQWESHPLDIYEFVTDRLRAVRQDLTIQRLSPDECIAILEPMVRFHALFGYLLCDHPRFEAHLNDKCLNECIAKLLECYPNASKNRIVNKHEIEILFSCLNVIRPEAVVQKIDFDKNSNILELVSAWTTNNYWRCFQLISKLDILARVSVARHVPELRARALTSMCHAMSSPNSAYPLERLTLTLSYNTVHCAMEDCKRLGIRYSEKSCHFLKKDLMPGVANATQQRWFLVDQALSNDFTRIILK